MTKNYSLGRNRYLSVKKQGGELYVTIAEEGSDVKTVTFPARRWARFVEIVGQVDEAINQMIAKQYVQLSIHLGGRWYVSVTTGFACVDIREYYCNIQKGPCPRKVGIALRISEYVTLKDVIQQIHKKYPELSTTQTCASQLDHQNQEGAFSCTECYPFQYGDLFHSLLV